MSSCYPRALPIVEEHELFLGKSNEECYVIKSLFRLEQVESLYIASFNNLSLSAYGHTPAYATMRLGQMLTTWNQHMAKESLIEGYLDKHEIPYEVQNLYERLGSNGS